MSLYLMAPGVEPVRIYTYGRRRPDLINKTKLVGAESAQWRQSDNVGQRGPSYEDFFVHGSVGRLAATA